jgi:hypothetical protein
MVGVYIYCEVWFVVTLALHDHVGIDSRPSKPRTKHYSGFDKEEDA